MLFLLKQIFTTPSKYNQFCVLYCLWKLTTRDHFFIFERIRWPFKFFHLFYSISWTPPATRDLDSDLDFMFSRGNHVRREIMSELCSKLPRIETINKDEMFYILWCIRCSFWRGFLYDINFLHEDYITQNLARLISVAVSKEGFCILTLQDKIFDVYN